MPQLHRGRERYHGDEDGERYQGDEDGSVTRAMRTLIPSMTPTTRRHNKTSSRKRPRLACPVSNRKA